MIRWEKVEGDNDFTNGYLGDVVIAVIEKVRRSDGTRYCLDMYLPPFAGGEYKRNREAVTSAELDLEYFLRESGLVKVYYG